MFEFLYYLFVVCFIIIEIGYLIDAKGKADNTIKFNKLSKIHKGKKWDEMPEDYKYLLKNLLWASFITIVAIIGGLFTFQWPIFVAILLLNLVIVAPLQKLLKKFKFTLISIMVTWINSLIGFIVGLFVIVNKYHLHIDICEFVEKFL